MVPNARLSSREFEEMRASFEAQVENLYGMLDDSGASRQDIFDQYVRLVSIFGNVCGVLVMVSTGTDEATSSGSLLMKWELRRLAPLVSARLGL
jgi:hypothetical protein